MKEQEPIAIHPLYRQLREKQLLIVDIKPTIRRALDEEARGLQKMRVTTTGLTPDLHGQYVSLDTFVQQKHFDFVVISPHPYILDDISEMIKTEQPLILLTDSYFVDKASNDAVAKWQQLGIPTVSKDSMKDLPQRVMTTMASMVRV